MFAMSFVELESFLNDEGFFICLFVCFVFFFWSIFSVIQFYIVLDFSSIDIFLHKPMLINYTI